MQEFGNQSKSYLSELTRLTKHNLIACGYQQLTVSSAAVSLTLPIDATHALIEVESSIATPAIRYLELGNITLPTATTGIRRSTLDIISIIGRSNLINFRAIQIGAGTHNLNIQYYK